MDIRRVCLLLGALVVRCCATSAQEPIVETEYGKVAGTVRFAKGSQRPVYSYFGVQYGRSPEYVFRFRPAEDPWNWDGVRDATNENRPLCIQDEERLEALRTNTYLKYLIPENPKMSENCLVVDVFSPRHPKEIEIDRGLLPVIVWLHGGSFQSFYSTTKLWALSAFEDVVLVQVQYRVGLFGFLTTDDAWAPPNSALQDQIKAMQWVQRNIKAFGGDPFQVTLMGESAGAVAVTSHIMLPESKGLFHRAFATSGAPNSMVWRTKQGEATDRIAKEVNCYFEDNAYTSTCLRNKINTTRLMQVAKDLNIIFTLQAQQSLSPDYPTNLVESKAFSNSVPLMLGVVDGEANYLLPRRAFSDIYFKGSKGTRQEAERSLKDFLSSRFPGGDIDRVMVAVVKEYMNPKLGDQGIKLLQGMLEAVGDCWFTSKASRFAEKLKEFGQNVFFFEFAHKSSMYEMRAEDFPRPFNSPQADHADDLLYAFGMPFVSELAGARDRILYFNDAERQLSRKYMKNLAHFAKTGLPLKEIDWPQYPKYAIIDNDMRANAEQYRPDRMDLWNEIIPSLAYGV